MNTVDKATLFRTMGLGPVWELKGVSTANPVDAVIEQGPPLMVVGDAAISEGLETETPFAGAPGELLERMLNAIEVDKNKHATLTHVPKHQAAETLDLRQSASLLMAQIQSQQPKALLLLGKLAGNVVLNCDHTVQDMRKQVHSIVVNGAELAVVVTHDLDHLLKRPEDKAKAWEDLLKLRRALA